jgi:hypothetical protein
MRLSLIVLSGVAHQQMTTRQGQISPAPSMRYTQSYCITVGVQLWNGTGHSSNELKYQYKNAYPMRVHLLQL